MSHTHAVYTQFWWLNNIIHPGCSEEIVHQKKKIIIACEYVRMHIINYKAARTGLISDSCCSSPNSLDNEENYSPKYNVFRTASDSGCEREAI